MSTDRFQRAVADEPVGWQAQKSAATRTLIVEAAIRCLVDLGYAGTTTTVIADRAGLSRGAMLHHFPAKVDVIRAAAESLHAKRTRALRAAVHGAVAADGERVAPFITAWWEHLRQPAFAAWHELALAARSDRLIGAILAPLQQAAERDWRGAIREALGGGERRGERADTVVELVRHALEGMAIAALTQRPPTNDAALLSQLEHLFREQPAKPGT